MKENTKEEVFKQLFELFIKNKAYPCKVNNKRIKSLKDFKHWMNYFYNDEKAQLLTILFEILPDEINLEWRIYFLVISRSLTGFEIFYKEFLGDKTIHSPKNVSKDIWKALHNLLLSIKEKGKELEFKWGE